VPISAALRQGPHNQGCNGGESLATCVNNLMVFKKAVLVLKNWVVLVL